MKFIILILTFHYQSILGNVLNDLILEENSNDLVEMTPKNLRVAFTNKINSKREENERLKLLRDIEKEDEILSVLDKGIVHIKVDRKMRNSKTLMKFEKEFRRLISSKGVRFIYKRNFKWRTWRKIIYSNLEKVISYVRSNPFNISSVNNTQYSHSGGGGVWNIDENPVCPYEIFGMAPDQNLCVMNYKHLSEEIENCSNIKIDDFLQQCDNPLRTEWHFEKVYDKNNLDSNLSTVICGDGDTCDFSTYYEIYENRTVFRLTNSKNTILYSKIMTPNQNYACVNHCGTLDPKTMQIESQPLSLNLFKNNSYKKKREMLKRKKVKNYVDDRIEDGVLKIFFDRKNKFITPSDFKDKITLHCKTIERLSKLKNENDIE